MNRQLALFMYAFPFRLRSCQSYNIISTYKAFFWNHFFFMFLQISVTCNVHLIKFLFKSQIPLYMSCYLYNELPLNVLTLDLIMTRNHSNLDSVINFRIWIGFSRFVGFSTCCCLALLVLFHLFWVYFQRIANSSFCKNVYF